MNEKNWFYYQNNNLLGFGEHIEEKHKVKIKRLEFDKYQYLYKIDHDDMVDMIADSTQIKNGIKEMNIIYNHKYEKIYMYHDDEWNEYRKERGLQQIVRVYQTYFFDYYEKFLIKRMYNFVDQIRDLYQNPNVNARMRNDCHHQLKQYYRYLAIFELKLVRIVTTQIMSICTNS